MLTTTQIGCYTAMLVAGVCGMVNFRKLDSPLKLISVLILLSIATEAAAYILAWKYQNNIALYNSFSLIQYLGLCLYFNRVIPAFNKNKGGLIAGSLGTIIWTVNGYILRGADEVATTFLKYEAFAIAIMSLGLIATYIQSIYNTPMDKRHFHIALISLGYWGAHLLYWCEYDFLYENYEEAMEHFYTIIQIANIIGYTAVGAVFTSLCNHKQQHVHRST